MRLNEEKNNPQTKKCPPKGGHLVTLLRRGKEVSRRELNLYAAVSFDIRAATACSAEYAAPDHIMS